MKVQLLIAAIISCIVSEKVRYDNFQIWTLKIETDAQLEALRGLYFEQNEIQLWSSPDRLGQFLEVVIPPNNLEDFKELVKSLEFKNKLMNDNLQNLIDNEQPKVNSGQFAFDRYRDTAELHQWLDEIISEHREVATPITIGYSWEGRPIKGVKISYGLNSLNTTIFVEANIHAREWIAPESTAWLIDQLLTGGDEDTQFMRHFDWYIIPTVNPDGLQYSHDVDRMWRKTRSYHPGNTCYGTDGNRNFHWSWNKGGSSDDSCNEAYMGPTPFSEKETRAIADFLGPMASKIELYLSFHSYSQLLMYPFGHTQDPFENQDDADIIAQAAAAELKSLYGTEYTVGNAQAVLYTTSGGSRDWAKGYHNIPLSFTYEMRDTGRYGFLLPAEEIIPNAMEIWRSLIALCRKGQELGSNLINKTIQ